MTPIRPQTMTLSLTLDGPGRLRRWLGGLALLGLFAVISWWANHSVKTALKREIANNLLTILSADVKAMTTWLDRERSTILEIPHQPEIQKLLNQLIVESTGGANSEIQPNAVAAELKSAITPALRASDAIFYVATDRNGRFIDGPQTLPMGDRFPAEFSDDFSKVLKGQTVVLPPHLSRLAAKDGVPQPVLAVVGPIFELPAEIQPDESPKVAGTLGFFYRLEDQFSEVLTVARSGESGETYAVDDSALLLSQSRFEAQLRSFGLLESSDSAMHIAVRDPGGDMTSGYRPSVAPQGLPMTLSAASLAQKAQRGDSEPQVIVEPYRDYRGVMVVGAWNWLPQYRFGIITEVDAAEAFASSRVLQRIFWSLMLIAAAALLGLIFYSAVVQTAWQKLRRAEKKLERLGQYDLVELIGKGGMGEVHRAKHAMMRRETAVKLLRPNVADATSVERFEREVQSTCQLNNPHTIQIFDFGRTPEGTFYYAMEYLAGIDLQQLVSRYGALPDGRAIGILTQICHSLAEAHSAKLIHRDIKPSNVMLCYRGGIPDFAKVLDFGLVRSLASDSNLTLTSDGAVAGTPAYMSPEATLSSAKLDARSDIYSLGCLAFYLLAGRAPFLGKNPIEVCWKQAREHPPALGTLAPQTLPPELESLVARCLAKSPDDRPQSTQEIIDVLTSITPIEPWTQTTAKQWWSQFKEATLPDLSDATQQMQGFELPND